MIRRDAVAQLLGLKPIVGEIRIDVLYAIRANAKLDAMWANAAWALNHAAPSSVSSDPVHLDPWESGWQRPTPTQQVYVIAVSTRGELVP